jgi:hypothetical protein
MHYLYFVIIPNEDNPQMNSERAREEATAALESEGFCSEGGYFSSGKSDWFVIGGRDSGLLSSAYNPFVTQTLKRDCTPAEREQLWKELGGDGSEPFLRDQYDEFGDDDDAQILTPQLLADLKREHGQTEVFIAANFEELPIAQLSDVYADGKHWIVVVDYHS